jgi:HAD superfamily hydrolase (TIGR01484 family)
MYKLIALDMDGTLLNPRGRISPRTQAAIAAARAKGVTVVLASGRPLEGMTAIWPNSASPVRMTTSSATTAPWCSRCPINASSAASC